MRLGSPVRLLAMSLRPNFAAPPGCSLMRAGLLALLTLVLLAPQALVWCRAGTDHTAIENALLGCCSAATGVSSCRTDTSSPIDFDRKTAVGVAAEPCTDVPFGPFAGVVRTDTNSLHFVAPLPAVPALVVAKSGQSLPPTPDHAARLGPIQSLLQSSVLTI